MRLLLVRHGESEWNRQRRMQGVADPPLSAEGRAQSERLRGLVEAMEPDAAVASDLRRARETLALLGRRDAPSDLRWRESDLGTWAGRLVEEVIASEGEAYRAWLEREHTPPGGEPWSSTCSRVREAVQALREAGVRRPLVVTHGGPIRAACQTLAGLPRSGLVPVPTASLTVIDLDGEGGRLRGFGMVLRPPPVAPTPD